MKSLEKEGDINPSNAAQIERQYKQMFTIQKMTKEEIKSEKAKNYEEDSDIEFVGGSNVSVFYFKLRMAIKYV
jgi:hypothetical protein